MARPRVRLRTAPPHLSRARLLKSKCFKTPTYGPIPMGANRDYERKTRRSKSLYGRALKVFAGGVSHNTRFYEPYPLFVKRARGKFIWDEDGNRYTDYWMGHTALILGHSPRLSWTDWKNRFGMGLSTEWVVPSQSSLPRRSSVLFLVPRW